MPERSKMQSEERVSHDTQDPQRLWEVTPVGSN